MAEEQEQEEYENKRIRPRERARGQKNMHIQQQEQNRSYFYSTLAAVITTCQGIIEEIQNSSETESHVWSKNKKKMIAKHNFCH